MEPDPWQQMILDTWLGRDERDKFSATTCGLSVPRQNGKNAIIEMRELYGIAVNGECILHTAHEVKTARKAFLRLASYFQQPEKYPELAELAVSVRRTNGQESIVLANGGMIEFSARSRGAARGFTIDCVVIDEAQELTDEQLEALMYAISASPNDNRQMIYTGTPPAPNGPGDVFTRLRKAATGKTPPDKFSWFEWSVPSLPENVEDKALWYETNPAMGYRISEEFTKTECATSSKDGFARERLGWWSSTGTKKTAIDYTKWVECATQEPPQGGKVCFGVKFSADGTRAAVCGVAMEQGGKPHVELVDYQDITAAGIQWIADFCAERRDKAALVAIDGRSNADALCDRLVDVGMPRKAYKRISASEAVASASLMVNYVKDGSLTHYNQPTLNKSVETSFKRPIGALGGFGFGGEQSEPIEAAALALWAVKNTRRNPQRKQRVR